MSFERNARRYWTRRGLTYEASYLDTEPRRLQEEAIVRLLAGLEFHSVLDVGCGFGRIGVLLGDVAYTGIDLSPDMLASAQAKIPDGRFRRVSLSQFDPGHQYDLVLAVEVLMHIRPSAVAQAVSQLRALSRRHLVTVDWSKPFAQGQQDSHNWIHPYRELYGEGLVSEVPVAWQTLYHVRP
jgi:SAM-dependent methyltransferase